MSNKHYPWWNKNLTSQQKVIIAKINQAREKDEKVKR
jgi:hypothetical protein